MIGHEAMMQALLYTSPLSLVGLTPYLLSLHHRVQITRLITQSKTPGLHHLLLFSQSRCLLHAFRSTVEGRPDGSVAFQRNVIPQNLERKFNQAKAHLSARFTLLPGYVHHFIVSS